MHAGTTTKKATRVNHRRAFCEFSQDILRTGIPSAVSLPHGAGDTRRPKFLHKILNGVGFSSSPPDFDLRGEGCLVHAHAFQGSQDLGVVDADSDDDQVQAHGALPVAVALERESPPPAHVENRPELKNQRARRQKPRQIG